MDTWLEIKTLQNAPRDADKLRRLLEVKQRQKEQAMHIEDTQRLVTEIEMLKVVSYLVSRKSRWAAAHNQVPASLPLSSQKESKRLTDSYNG
jgi:hypothetical protein